jgi:hypothetical protein
MPVPGCKRSPGHQRPPSPPGCGIGSRAPRFSKYRGGPRLPAGFRLRGGGSRSPNTLRKRNRDPPEPIGTLSVSPGDSVATARSGESLQAG